MTREELAERILALPEEIHRWQKTASAARLALEQCRADLIIGGEITGKNQAERDAQMDSKTADLAAVVESARAELALAENRFTALRSVARLLWGGPIDA